MSGAWIEDASRKCVLFASTVRYCGRLTTKDGVRFDPKNMEALQTMQEPQNGADLIQYVGAVNWMRSAILNYSKRVVLLQAALAKVFEGKSHRTKKAAAAVSLLHFGDQRSRRLSKIYKQLSWSQ
jgi:hypothetical protein